MQRGTQRKFLDIIDLAAQGFEVKVNEEKQDELYVKMHVDPKYCPQLNVSADICPYMGGVWWLRIELPERYPSSSPSVAFVNKIFHPNVEERSGSICLDVLNQTWSPMFTLTQALSTFIAQLLCYPNPHDPMNSEAAALLLQNQTGFVQKVREHSAQYATQELAAQAILRETQGRSFYEPDAEAVRRKGSRKEPGTPAPSSLSSTASPSELAGGATVSAAEDDAVSEASDIDLDTD